MTFTVAGYQLERQLGQGSQGEVWLAEETATGDRFALKWIALDRPEAAELARTEAALLAKLDHPSLIALREFRICEGGFVLVLELAEAGSMANLLRRRNKLTPAEVVAAISPVASALAHAHNAGILHGDVSPANILFSATGHPKLADLGVARLVAGVGAGTGMGTPAYLDPVIAAGGAAGLASDVFSLAAVTLHTLTGGGPWLCPGIDQPSADQVLGVAATGRILDLDSRLAEVPPGMAAVLIRALDHDPIRRGTAAEFALDLRAALPPSPVVLAGGRITAPVGRHAAEHRSLSPVGGGRTALDSSASRSFLAVDGSGPEFVPADLTRVSRPLIRALPPPVPEPESISAVRRFVHHMIGGSMPRAGLVIGLLGVLVAAGVLGWPLLRHQGSAATAAAPVSATAAGSVPALRSGAGSKTSASAASGPASILTPATTTKSPSASRPPSMTVNPSLSTSQPVSAAEATAWLTRLDDLRSAAFAQRRPDLLSQVYASASLVAADTATLNRVVPSGCTLTGLHTSYRNPRLVKQDGRNITVLVVAALPAGLLSCPGQPVASTAPLGPQPLVIGLSDDGRGFRIVSQSAS